MDLQFNIANAQEIEWRLADGTLDAGLRQGWSPNRTNRGTNPLNLLAKSDRVRNYVLSRRSLQTHLFYPREQSGGLES